MTQYKDLFAEWGFANNPMDVSELRANDRGKALFVGRFRERRRLATQLRTAPCVSTVEADYGVGKTSLANRVAFDLTRAKDDQPQFLLCNTLPSLNTEADFEAFEGKLYVEIGRTIATAYRKSPFLTRCRNWLSIEADLDRLLCRAIGRNYTLGPAATDVNVNDAVSISGLIGDWLDGNLDREGFGGVICILDGFDQPGNEPDGSLRSYLQHVRDRLLTRRGLRWILCGPPGFFETSVQSSSMKRYLAKPILLPQLTEEEAIDAFTRRLEYDSVGHDSYFPMNLEHFRQLYRTHRSLSETLKSTGEFCQWLVANDLKPPPDEQARCIQRWAAQSGDWDVQAAFLKPRPVVLIKALSDAGGLVTLKDLPDNVFDEFNREQAKAVIQYLEELGLVRHESSSGMITVTRDGERLIDALKRHGKWNRVGQAGAT